MTKQEKQATFDYDRLDDVIHGKIRLGIFSYLSTVESASFVELRDALKATPGNISANLAKLEDAGYVQIGKSFKGNRPLTTIAFTASGRKAWSAYLGQLSILIQKSQATVPQKKDELQRTSARSTRR